MTHVVTENCILCKHTECVDVCPVDCFRETPLMMVIDPDECIDCAVCIPECPVNAIYAEEDVPKEQLNLIKLNKKLSFGAAPLTRRKSPLANASTWKNVPGKSMLLEGLEADSQSIDFLTQGTRYQDLANAASIPPDEWRELLENSDPVVRLITASRKDFELDKVRLADGLQDEKDAIRRLYVRKAKGLLSESQISTLLNDSSESVRLEVVNFHASCFNEKHFDIALNDKNVDVRLTVIRSPEFQPSGKQYLKVLESESREEVQAMLSRSNDKLIKLVLSHPSASLRSIGYGYYFLKLTESQIQDGLNDKEMAVKMAVIQRPDFKPTQLQFEDFVKHGQLHLVEAASRKASAECLTNLLTLSDEDICKHVIRFTQALPVDLINKCLSEPRSQIAIATISKLGRKLTQKQLGICLKSSDEEVRREAVTAYGVDRLPSKYVVACLQDSDEKIRVMAASNSSIELDPDQLEKLLVDRSLHVRLAAAARSDFAPNKLQYKRGLSDKSSRVRELYSSRFKTSKGAIIDQHKQVVQTSTVDLYRLLDDILKLKTWTKKKYLLKDELSVLLDRMNYMEFKVDARNALLSQFGEHRTIEVPMDKRGHLQSMRGKKVHLICLGHGRYSTILFAAKAI